MIKVSFEDNHRNCIPAFLKGLLAFDAQRDYEQIIRWLRERGAAPSAKPLPKYSKNIDKKYETTAPDLPKKNSYIFLSYAHEDLEWAHLLAKAPENRGWSVFSDHKIPPGQTWRNFIGAALRDASCILVLWSKASVESEWVIEEAIEKTNFFLPVLSREADDRREGVFWDEWKSALRRSRRIKGAFLLPVGIDPEPPSINRYLLISFGVTAEFFDKHLIHAPGGDLRAEDREALSERCRRFQEDNHD